MEIEDFVEWGGFKKREKQRLCVAKHKIMKATR